MTGEVLLFTAVWSVFRIGLFMPIRMRNDRTQRRIGSHVNRG
jgi:hypothetical protein